MENLLCNSNLGEYLVIHKLKDSSFRVKMMEMGLIEGKRLKILFRAPFGGPIAIDVEGYTLSLRMDEAMLVIVKKLAD